MGRKLSPSERMVVERLRDEIAGIAIELVQEWMCGTSAINIEPMIRNRLVNKVNAYEAAKRGH